MPSKGIHGRASGFSGVDKNVISCRLKPHDDGGIFTVVSTAYDHNVATANGFFRSDSQADATYHARYGYDGGARQFLRLTPTGDCFVKFGSVDDRSHKVSADTTLELAGRDFQNIFLRSAGGTAAQVQRIDTVADVSGSLNNKYFIMYVANNTTGHEERIGVWFNVNSAGTQPTNTNVDQWAVVALSTNATANQVATALEAVIEAITVQSTDAFSSSVSTNQVTVTWNATFTGSQRDAADSSGSTATGFTFNTPSTNGAGTAFDVTLFMI